MSDKELIIKLLQKVEKRVRLNTLGRDLTFWLSIFLLFPLGFKLLDLLTPFRTPTVATTFSLWLAALIAYVLWRSRRKGGLNATAVSVDQKASLRDEIKSAYWFVTNPSAAQRSSEWVELQIGRAAQRVNSLDLPGLYPRVFPRTGYVAGVLILLWVGLNFVPLPFNHNWIYLQGAPAFALSEREQDLLKRTKELLARAQKLEQTDLADKLEEIMKNLQDGKVAPNDALQQLDDIQNSLGEGNLDLASINEGLDEIARDFEQNNQLQGVGQAMAKRELNEAADQMRSLAEKLDQSQLRDLKEIEQTLKQASEENRPGLDDLSNDLKQASEDIKNQDMQAAEQALQQAAGDLEDLSKKLESQSLKNAASQQLQKLEESLRGRQQAAQAQQKTGGKRGDPREAQQGKPGSEDGDDQGDPQQTGAANGGQSQQEGASPGQGQEPGAPGEGGTPTGQGDPSGTPHGPLPLQGAATKLDVQLEKEELTGLHDPSSKPEDIEEASKQERSKLDYRNVRSELSPAQKDVLNQDKIPWEYRNLIKNYFQAIRPTGRGATGRPSSESLQQPTGESGARAK
jgi:hypothetical protein